MKREPNIRIDFENPKQAERLFQILLTVGIWIVIGILLAMEWGILNALGYNVPQVGWIFPASVAFVLSAFIWHPQGWETIKRDAMARIDRGFAEKISTMDNEELQKVREGIQEMRLEMGFIGIHQTLDTSEAKQKRAAVDEYITRLSNEDLVQLQSRIQAGTITDETLYQEMMQNQ